MSDKTKITVEASINAPIEKVWECYTQPEHITKWNFASDDWHCPSAENDLRVGGKLNARMEAKDGSNGFNFEAIYTEIIPHKKIVYKMLDERNAEINFDSVENQTEVIITFEAENVYPVALQKAGWQAILNNFKEYVENKLIEKL
ncbi:MAG: SRPBCC family protein [Ignavibacterium sp.]|nr:SRPBCC family protein [Ignavibacterium sp.]